MVTSITGLAAFFAGCSTTSTPPSSENATDDTNRNSDDEGATTTTSARTAESTDSRTTTAADRSCGRWRVTADLPAKEPNDATVRAFSESEVAEIPRLADLVREANEEYRPWMGDIEERKLLAATWSATEFERADAIRDAIGYREEFYVEYEGTVFVLEYVLIEC